MTINKQLNGSEIIFSLEGRLDTTTSPALEAQLKDNVDNVDSLVIDMEKLDYLSSAGLRVILSAQKVMSKKDGMIVKNVNETIMEVFEVTGFVDILTII